VDPIERREPHDEPTNIIYVDLSNGYQIMITKIWLPNNDYQIMITKNGYQNIVTKNDLSNDS